MEERKIIKGVLWAWFLISLYVGIALLEEASTEYVYPTSSYWVAKDYHHVYAKHSGRIENVISEDETCVIVGDEIIVTSIDKIKRGWGLALSIIFGSATLVMICYELGKIDIKGFFRELFE